MSEYYTKGEIIIVDIATAQEYAAQFVPESLEIDHSNSYEKIQVPQRTAPDHNLYGSEVKFPLTLDFVGTTSEIKEVREWLKEIQNKEVAIVWGEIFDGKRFIITSYKENLSLFVNGENFKPTRIQVTINFEETYYTE